VSIVEHTNKKIVVKGIVRRYHVPENKNYNPYVGMLMSEEDQHSQFGQMYELLKDVEDGEAITITVECHGIHPNAKGHVWMLTKPNTYERVKDGVEKYWKTRK
jgi:hypothetical protein